LAAKEKAWLAEKVFWTTKVVISCSSVPVVYKSAAHRCLCEKSLSLHAPSIFNSVITFGGVLPWFSFS
jgi:hypothetical protein